MWIDAFVEYLRCEKNRSERTVEGYRRDLEVFESYMKALDENISWDTLDKDIVRQWMVERMEQGLKPRSICAHLSALRSFYKFLLRRKLVARDPVQGIQGPKLDKPLPQFVRESDMDRLLDGGYFPNTVEGERDRLVLLLFYSTGVRLAELVGLDWEDVDLAAGQLKVTGKRDKQRIVPFGPELCDTLDAYRGRMLEEGRAEGALFRNLKTGERISRAKVAEVVRRYLSQVTTLKKRSPHVLRHSFATSMLNHHADLQSVKELLGHESLATTEIYTHTTFEELKDMYNLAHPRA